MKQETKETILLFTFTIIAIFFIVGLAFGIGIINSKYYEEDKSENEEIKMEVTELRQQIDCSYLIRCSNNNLTIEYIGSDCIIKSERINNLKSNCEVLK